MCLPILFYLVEFIELFVNNNYKIKKFISYFVIFFFEKFIIIDMGGRYDDICNFKGEIPFLKKKKEGRIV